MPALGPVLETIGSLTERIREYDRKLEEISKESYPETELLRQVEGIGALTALTFVLTVEDPYRFEKSRLVGAYLGACARQGSVGGPRSPEAHLQGGRPDAKETLRLKRPLHPWSVRTGLRPPASRREDQPPRRGKNAKKRAVVAVARKLAVLLHSLWISAEVYEPLRNTHSLGGQAA